MQLGKTVRTLKKELGRDELLSWVAWSGIEGGLPFEKEQQYLAQISQYIFNMNVSKGYEKPLSHFRLEPKEEPKPMSGKQIFAELAKLKKLKVHKGKDKK